MMGAITLLLRDREVRCQGRSLYQSVLGVLRAVQKSRETLLCVSLSGVVERVGW